MLFFESRDELCLALEKKREIDQNVRILYMGCPEFSVPPLRRILDEGWQIVGILTQPDRPVGRKQKICAPPLKEFALSRSLPVYQWENLRDQEVLEKFKSLKADLFITSAYGQILPASILELPRLGAINIHPSALPRFRGASPVASAILAGDKETAVCIMKMEEALDSGAIFAQLRVPLKGDETEEALLAELGEDAADLLAQLLPDLVKGNVCPQDQGEEGVSYAPKFTREDGRLDFSKTAKEVDQRVRACSPWPGSFAFLDGKKYKFLETTWHEEDLGLVPGTVRVQDARFLIACAKGCLEVIKVQLPSGKKCTSAQCAHNFKEGDCFSPNIESEEV